MQGRETTEHDNPSLLSTGLDDHSKPFPRSIKKQKRTSSQSYMLSKIRRMCMTGQCHSLQHAKLRTLKKNLAITCTSNPITSNERTSGMFMSWQHLITFFVGFSIRVQIVVDASAVDSASKWRFIECSQYVPERSKPAAGGLASSLWRAHPLCIMHRLPHHGRAATALRMPSNPIGFYLPLPTFCLPRLFLPFYYFRHFISFFPSLLLSSLFAFSYLQPSTPRFGNATDEDAGAGAGAGATWAAGFSSG